MSCFAANIQTGSLLEEERKIKHFQLINYPIESYLLSFPFLSLFIHSTEPLSLSLSLKKKEEKKKRHQSKIGRVVFKKRRKKLSADRPSRRLLYTVSKGIVARSSVHNPSFHSQKNARRPNQRQRGAVECPKERKEKKVGGLRSTKRLKGEDKRINPLIPPRE